MAGARGPVDYYAVLGIDAHATAAEVTAAYRNAAKRLHPDVPGTGDRAGFLRLGEAYQVLGDPMRRAAYDQAGRADSRPGWRQEEPALGFVAPISWRLPPYARPLLVVVILLALGQFGWRFFAPGISAPGISAPGISASGTSQARVGKPAAPMVAVLPPAGTPDVVQAGAGAGAEQPAFTADHFIGPGSGPALLWRRVPDRVDLVRADLVRADLVRVGQLPAFTPLMRLRPPGADGLAEIRAADGQTGWTEATRLLPGDARAARHAGCLYHAGAPPRGGFSLIRAAADRSGGTIQVAVENREDRPAVFKLRDAGDAVAAALYLAPRGQAVIENLRPGPYRAEFAIGDLWSTACGVFLAGMRAWRLAQPQDLPREATGAVRFTISATMVAEDISDEAFARD